MYYLFLFIIIVTTFLVYRYRFVLLPFPKLTILMYHKIDPSKSDKLTVTIKQFESQLLYLKNKNYEPITFRQLILYQTSQVTLPRKPIIISFDDAYENNFEHLYPLLIKHRCKATIFLPVGHLGNTNCWDEGAEKIMNYNRLKEMDSTHIEFGLHSYNHENYKFLSNDEILTDINRCIQELQSNSIPFVPVIAYPYGGYPRNKKKYKTFVDTLKQAGVVFGARIGNKINFLPVKDPFCLKRIDIHGTDSLTIFKKKIRTGKVKIF